MTAPRYLDESPELLDALARVEVLYTDLDGTLLGPGGTLLADGEGAPSVTCASAVVAVNRAGLDVVVVSGRSHAQLLELARICGWNDFIGEAGAVRSYWRGDRRETVFETPGWPEGLPSEGRTAFDEIVAVGAFERLSAAFPGRIEYHDPWHLGRDATHVLRGCLDCDAGQRVLDELPLAVDLVDNGVIRRRSGSLTCDGPLHAYHIVPRGVSKRAAIEADLRERGLTSSQAAMIGDSPADLETAGTVAVAALVENALEVEGLGTAMGAHPNAALVRGQRGDGWAEFARMWLTARGLS